MAILAEGRRGHQGLRRLYHRPYDDGRVVDYKLTKFMRSNHTTCINQRPIVTAGQRVEKGDVMVDGPSTSHGEIALGKNILMGFMTWEGYNYEDAILLNERMVKEDVFTSIHIEEYETESATPSWGPRRSPGISPTWARTP